MDKFNSNFNGGLPFKLDDNRWQDNGYRTAFKGLMSAYGVDQNRCVLLSGCGRIETGGTVTIQEGYVSIGGEICFVPTHSYPSPGTLKEYWVINSSFHNSGNKQFKNLTNHDTYEIRIGKVAVASSVPSGSTKYNLTESIYDVINRKADTVPVGFIGMWSGLVSTIPIGYSLCDGDNNTPDLRGRFIVSYDNRSTNPNNNIWDLNYNTIGNDGGEKKHSLSSAELPAHQHPFGLGVSDSGDPNDPIAIIVPSATQGNHDYDPISVRGNTSSNSVNGSAHNNLPPYYVLAFIMKTSTSTPVSPSNPIGTPQVS